LPEVAENGDGTIAPLAEAFAAQRVEGERCIVRDAIQVDEIRVHHVAEMAYIGQVHRIGVAVDPRWSAARLFAAFTAAYEREYGVTLPGSAVTVVNANTTLVGVREAAPTHRTTPARKAAKPVATRSILFDEWVETPIYRRVDLADGSRIDGPAVIEQPDTTTVIEPGTAAWTDEFLNLRVEMR
jgi:N-methylhydantoinase A